MFKELLEKTQKIKELLEKTQKINEYFDPQYPEDIEEVYQREHIEAMGVDYDALMKAISETFLAAVDGLNLIAKYAQKHNITTDHEMPGDYPTHWIESTDAWDMAKDGDFSAVEEHLQEIIDYSMNLNDSDGKHTQRAHQKYGGSLPWKPTGYTEEFWKNNPELDRSDYNENCN